ncbi:hypothetical protein BDA96_09G024400 [Sorghum bicolor]|uniref:Uncharacterized protein n=2 Tax=Sorghum bicolor TaxID=4558 RepID=A0A921Q7Q5_SORBI|nr:hypothetical protein BDA96_09G024400 [Sorghum bicolor]OQU77278.1 hypothetical protein SORBI_3009G023501 [Sorghum bicolor]
MAESPKLSDRGPPQLLAHDAARSLCLPPQPSFSNRASLARLRSTNLEHNPAG